LWMKDQESLGLVANANGWKLGSNNEMIQKLNKDNPNKQTVEDYLNHHKDKFDTYNAWMPMNKVTAGLSNIPFNRFMEELELRQNSNSNEQVAISKEPEETVTRSRGRN
jgi:hypothetical protein